MAQFETSSTHKRVKGKKIRRSIFVDLTPMVDLAFLLITFFMLTTAMSRPSLMELAMPKKEPTIEIPESRVITFIADAENKLWFYEGYSYDQVMPTDYSTEGIRKIIYDKMELLKKTSGMDVICLIKLTDESNYQNMVDILDEMDVTNVKTYAIQDLLPEETEAISQIKNK